MPCEERTGRTRFEPLDKSVLKSGQPELVILFGSPLYYTASLDRHLKYHSARDAERGGGKEKPADVSLLHSQDEFRTSSHMTASFRN